MALLFEPLTIKSVVLKNRIAVSPMCQYSAEDGFANHWHLVHLGSRAVGGAGLIIQEATAVSPEGRISSDCLGIWKDEHIAMLKTITDFIHGQHSVACIQLAHAGRKGSHSSPFKGAKLLAAHEGGWQRMAPSPLPYLPGDTAPHELTVAELQHVIADFRRAAERALKANYDVIELHAAHGYLIHEFLSPLTNARTDAYGGSFENRTRLLLEVIDAVKEIWPLNKPLFVRISASDWAEGGWNIEESVLLSKLLKDLGIDLIDCSSGGLVPQQKISLGPGYQVPFAGRIRIEANIKTGAVGLITEAKQAEEILQLQQADLIIMAREFLRDPYFPLHAAKELGVDVKWPVQYERAKLK